jgi:Major Facilitator Superfamily
MRETNAAIILARKASRLRKETGNLQLHYLHVSPSPRQFAERALLRPLRVLLFSPIVLLTGMNIALIFGLTYLLFATFPTVFEETYHWEVGVTGLAYLGFGIGCIIALVTFSLLSDRLLGKDGTPERRLILMMAAGPCVPIGIFWYGWAADRGVQWIVPIIGTSFIGLGTLVVSSSSQLYIIDMAGPRGAASALAALTLVRNASGAFLPLVADPLYDRLGLGWGNSVLGFATLAFTPVPFILYKYGGWLREIFPLKL